MPVVITFHDTNDSTASHMQEYFEILVEESRRVGLPLTPEPFYNERYSRTRRSPAGSNRCLPAER